MNWYEEALAERENIAQYEAKKPLHLSINTEDDIPSDCSRFTHVHFTSNYEGPSPAELLPGIILLVPIYDVGKSPTYVVEAPPNVPK